MHCCSSILNSHHLWMIERTSRAVQEYGRYTMTLVPPIVVYIWIQSWNVHTLHTSKCWMHALARPSSHTRWEQNAACLSCEYTSVGVVLLLEWWCEVKITMPPCVCVAWALICSTYCRLPPCTHMLLTVRDTNCHVLVLCLCTCVLFYMCICHLYEHDHLYLQDCTVSGHRSEHIVNEQIVVDNFMLAVPASSLAVILLVCSCYCMWPSLP